MSNDDTKQRIGNISRMCSDNVMGFKFNDQGRLKAIGGCMKARDFRRTDMCDKN
ncbi:hypothetical protein D1BOALGB6SA_10326 [Olavius sp. associated proteobacterium Delta 1]|nr:hypothetical protein D1BOALGB6SA_10326 [Olavius sp. associated proteobacterium Delta 1]